MSSSPAGITSEAPANVHRRPSAVNISKVKKEFSKLIEIFALYAKDMSSGDIVTFSQYTEKYKETEIRYNNIQATLRMSSEVSRTFDRFLGKDDGQLYADRVATAASLASDMRNYVMEMTFLVEDFLPDDDTDAL